MAKIYKPVKIVEIGTGGGGGGGGNPPFTASFTTLDWVTVSTEYVYTVMEATHGLGPNVQADVFERVGNDFELVDVETVTDLSGNVEIKLAITPDTRFNGKVVIVGE